MSTPNQLPSTGAKHFFTLADIADRYDVNTRTVRRWVIAGELIAHRFGRQMRVSVEDLKTFEKLRRGV